MRSGRRSKRLRGSRVRVLRASLHNLRRGHQRLESTIPSCMRHRKWITYNKELWQGELRYADHQVCAARKQVAKEAGSVPCSIPRESSMVGDRNQSAGRGGSEDSEYPEKTYARNIADKSSYTATASAYSNAYNVHSVSPTRAWTQRCQ
jgi:hypothetical protein